MSDKQDNFLSKYFTRLAEKAYQTFSQKRLLLMVSLCFLFFLTLPLQESFFETYLMPKESISFPVWLDVFFILMIIALSYYWIIRIWIYEYRASFSQLLTITFASIILLYPLIYKQKDWQWDYFNIPVLEIPYVFLSVIPGLLFLILAFLKMLQITYQQAIKKEKNHNDNYESDQPLDPAHENAKDYDNLLEQLKRAVNWKSKPEAFSIGIVGPWGNGKSSLLKLLKYNLNPPISIWQRLEAYISFPEKRDILVLEFSPYLNHNENEIAQEFFLLLSNTLCKYHGKLGPLLLAYAQKLTNLYTKKDLTGFLSKPANSLHGKSAGELYTTINNLLEELDKKVVILVDDLDRLRSTEILEVLKILRNTASFHHLIFVVAMDKEYVVRRLKDQGEISNARFIDKFFQLEFYLPQVPREKLLMAFKKQVATTIFSSDARIENAFDLAMTNPGNLFADYCRNYRDVKRLANQVRLEYPILGKEIHFKDFINITCFKMRFPQVVSYINKNRNDILRIDTSSNFFYLAGNNLTDQVTEQYDGTLDSQITTERIVHKYRVFSSESKNAINLKQDLQIDDSQYPLLVKSLAYLFGEENEIESTDSIKYENNFRLFMQQRMDEVALSNDAFRSIIDQWNKDQLMDELNSLSEDGLFQLKNRLEYFNSDNHKELLRAIFVIAYLIDTNGDKFFSSEEQLLTRLNNFAIQLLRRATDSARNTISLEIQTQTLENENVSIETKVRLLTYVYENKSESQWWSLGGNTFSEKGLVYFNAYMEEHRENPWNYDDFTWAKLYHSLKKISGIQKELNKAFKQYWKTRDTEVLCVQLLKIDDYSFQLFKLSDIIPKIFGTYESFVTFVKQDRTRTEILAFKLYKDFLKLAAIANFDSSILYNFKDWPRMQEKIADAKTNPGRGTYDELQGKVQAFFELDDQEMFHGFKSSNIIEDTISTDIMWFLEHAGKCYIATSPKFYKSTPEHFMTYVELLRKIAKEANWHILDKTEAQIKNGEVFITKKEGLEDRSYVKLISYQP